MQGNQAAAFALDAELADEAATQRLAAELAAMLAPGDVVSLAGDLGAGKTAFARMLIRHLAEDPALEVPSPTFTLMQAYAGAAFPILHADFYRLRGSDELDELGFEEAREGALTLVEWAERAPACLPAGHIEVAMSLDLARGDTFRHARISGHGDAVPRLRRALAVGRLLQDAGWGGASRAFMLGDASTRAYERLTKPSGETAILMISPPRADGPPVKHGKPYSAVARLAEDIAPFIAIDAGLRAQGFSAPQIYAHDIASGLALTEDFGGEPFVDDGGPMPDRYGEAVGVLARLHRLALPSVVEAAPGRMHAIPPYDIEAQLIEVELLPDWYAPHIGQKPLSSAERADFVERWRALLAPLADMPSTWALRDFHSPNLIWLGGRAGLSRVGLIDFQDCVLGHPAYDLVSLLQDARVDVPDALELKLLGLYAHQRRLADPGFDMAGFAGAYAILGAQRATKILGIFARLDKRDRKPHYLRHLPRMQRYLAKNLAHPMLRDLRFWYETHLPRLVAAAS